MSIEMGSDGTTGAPLVLGDRRVVDRAVVWVALSLSPRGGEVREVAVGDLQRPEWGDGISEADFLRRSATESQVMSGWWRGLRVSVPVEWSAEELRQWFRQWSGYVGSHPADWEVRSVIH